MSTEFVKQSLRENLARTLVPHISDGLWSIYDNAKTACERNQQPEKTLQTFQNLLTRIPQWTDDVLRKEVDRIRVTSKCDYIEDLLLGVFVSYIRAFASLQQVEASHVQVEFERPSLEKFIHEFYKSSARKSWSNAYLFKTIGVSSEQQARNRRDIETMIDTCMGEVIDGFIPWRDISKAYFQARDTSAPAAHAAHAAPAAPPSTPVRFEKENEVREFEKEEEEDEDEDEDEVPPRLQLGEETTLEDFGDDSKSVDTETELAEKADGSISLNL